MRKRDVLIVDGYNIIGSWEVLKCYQQDDIQTARDLLLFELSNYAKYKAIQIIVVFDAQFVPGLAMTFEQYNVTVVFTSEGETADSYIEREVRSYINPLNRVVVATSDMAEQWMVFQQGALRQSAQELLIEVEYAKQQINQEVQTYYNQMAKRKSPWRIDQLEILDYLRHTLPK